MKNIKKSQNHIVFIHGWGLDSQAWEGLESEKGTVLDMGFTGRAEATSTDECDILITHSLGTLWAAHHQIKPKRSWIAINSFTNFMDFTDQKTLDTMKNGIDKNAAAQMKLFYRQAGFVIPKDAAWNKEKLKEGLDWLATWKLGEEKPDLVLSGAKDRIAPIDAITEQWQDVKHVIHPEAGHALPVSHPEWCIDQIKAHIT